MRLTIKESFPASVRGVHELINRVVAASSMINRVFMVMGFSVWLQVEVIMSEIFIIFAPHLTKDVVEQSCRF